jgi:hypothetical protein
VKNNSSWLVGDSSFNNFWFDNRLGVAFSTDSSLALNAKMIDFILDYQWHILVYIMQNIPNLCNLFNKITIPKVKLPDKLVWTHLMIICVQ